MRGKENDLIFEAYSKSMQRRLAVQKDSPKPKSGPTKPFKKDALKPIEAKTVKAGAKFCAKHEE